MKSKCRVLGLDDNPTTASKIKVHRQSSRTTIASIAFNKNIADGFFFRPGPVQTAHLLQSPSSLLRTSHGDYLHKAATATIQFLHFTNLLVQSPSQPLCGCRLLSPGHLRRMHCCLKGRSNDWHLPVMGGWWNDTCQQAVADLNYFQVFLPQSHCIIGQ